LIGIRRSKSDYQRKTISFNVESFNNIVKQIDILARSGVEIDPENFYPPLKKHKGKSRDLPMVDNELRNALNEYLMLRVGKSASLKPSDPLFITQKDGSYSPNTLQ
jgi:hypothetical protein